MRRPGGWRRRLVPGEGPLASVPPAAMFLVVAAAFAAGVLVGGVVGAGVLLVLALLVGALLAVAWPRLAPAERAVRLVVLFAVLAVALSVLDR